MRVGVSKRLSDLYCVARLMEAIKDNGAKSFLFYGGEKRGGGGGGRGGSRH